MTYESDIVFSYEIADDGQNLRLDTYISSRAIDLTRSKIQALIKNGHVKVNNTPSKSSYRLKAGDQILVSIPPAPSQLLKPEAVEFRIVHEDSSLIVVDKPAGVVVHPGPGHATGTLVHGLIRHCRDLSRVGGVYRPGIVHRLDKDTSGLIVAAKNDQSHAFLAHQFKTGRVRKQYVAIVHGQIKTDGGEIDLPIARHPKKRKQMAVVPSGGRRALTVWRKVEVFHSYFSLLLISIKTGRTHQIRVHLSHIGHPVVGDSVYGYGRNRWKRHPLYKAGVLPAIDRQMLHAKKLGFIHPVEGQYMEFKSPIPGDMDRVIQSLKSLNLVAM